MPGYVIHLAVAEEYLKKNTDKKEDYNKFIEGVIAPDDVEDKSLTHYGKTSSKTNLYEYLKENKVNTSYDRGYFLHLLTDYLFYNKYLEYFSKDIYNDYDILNSYLIPKYNIKIPEKVKNRASFKKGATKILSEKLVDKIINEISDYDIDDTIMQIKEDPIKWTKFRTLKIL